MTTEALARAVASLRYEDLPQTTRQNAKQCFLDWLACCICGAPQPAAEILRREIAREGGGAPAATVFSAAPFRASALNAALLNGAASHALDMDDLHNASIIHLGTVVAPAALAVAERDRLSGRELIAAIVAGYEAGARVGEAVNPGSYFFWHTTGTAGTFGAAAAAARLLKLDAAATVSCFGSAGTQAAGLWEFLIDGAMSKSLHAGKAAMNGILAADLAKAGFTAARQILEGEKGFCRAMTAEPDLAKLTEGLGERYEIDENGFKAYTCCRHCHAAINAAQILRIEEEISPADVAAITVKTNRVAAALVDNPAPKTAYGHKFSLQYCTAAAVTHGRVGLAEFSEAAVAEPETRRLMAATQVVVDAALDAEYARDPKKWSAEVAIETRGGKRFSRFVPYPKGDPQNPLSYAETEEKFRGVATPVLGGERTARLLAVCAGLERVPDIAAAFAFLTA
ncbi:MmgE/PrpD family protein [Oleispirillum naphthae]|uniref:MmgE/PrpD family protein n=1 Tax=Oleispirillum naphthae TaxID=2838853 RepID=UPI0030825C8F